MGEIRKDNLHESLIEELNELANIDLSGKQDKTDESLLTESKDVIGAINELFQSANNGKELIASAIGEPLNSEDTFSAMSNDINSLLSTFKTNMMNNGVTVESGDKFKALIDKIATIAEEGSGKGIQFAEGTSDVSISSSKSSSTGTITTNLDFTPSIIFILSDVTFTNTKTMTHTNVLFSNNVSGKVMASNANAAINQYVAISNITYENFTVTLTSNNCSGSMTIKTWYAIGVGEEDTTLRDSLASILTEEGVSVTEEDDMASLINKVDEEFDRQVVPQGTAGPEHVLQGVSFMNSTGNVQNGNIPILSSNYGTEQHYMTNEIQVGDYSGAGGQCLYFKIPRYWYTNVDWVMSYVPDLLPENIVSGKSICGVIGGASATPKLTASSSGSYNLAKNITGLYIGFGNTSANPPVSEVFQCTVMGSGSVYVSLRLIGEANSNSSGHAQFVVSRTRSGSKTEVAASDLIYFDNSESINASFTISDLLPGDVLTFGMRNRQYFYLGGTFYVDGVLCNVSY